MNTIAAVSRRSWVVGILALALLTAWAAIQLAISHGAPAKPETRITPAGDLAGHWSGELQGDELRLEMKMSKAPLSNWESVDSYPVSQLAGFTPGRATRFELRRDAGLFQFQGSFQGGRGHGTVTFRSNPRFSQDLGVPIPPFGLLELAVYDVSLGYAREMKDLGLVAYRRQKPNPWQGLWGDLMGRREPPVQRLIELRSQGVTPEFARGVMAACREELRAWDLIELRRQGVDGDFIREAQSRSHRPLTVPEILALRTRGGLSS